MADGTETLTGLIPVVVTGGILMKFTEYAFPQQPKRTVRRTSRKSKKGIVSSRIGDFRSVGY